MGLVAGGATGAQLVEEQEEEEERVGEEQPGETGSTLTMAAGGDARQTGGVRTTAGQPERGAVRTRSNGWVEVCRTCEGPVREIPGLVWSRGGRPCRMRVLVVSGSPDTHRGRGWMGGLLLRMVVAFRVAELGSTGKGGRE